MMNGEIAIPEWTPRVIDVDVIESAGAADDQHGPVDFSADTVEAAEAQDR